MTVDRRKQYESFFRFHPEMLKVSARARELDNLAPKSFDVKIPLVEFFERIRRVKADRWQHDFCRRLQDAAVNRHIEPVKKIVHAEGQLGKSSILAQAYPAWLLGHDPLHRIALATYNVRRSQAHSSVVIRIMQSGLYKDIFEDVKSHIPETVSKEKWNTFARLQHNDGQDSFNPVGLQSGLTGTGFDTLIIDDPYADQKEAFSPTIRNSLQEFWDFTVLSRLGEYSNVFGMFHRYHVQDLAGYLLNTGDFDYLRYASVCDGDYVHDETGQRFPDPLNREVGEYISERRGASYYATVRKKPRIWNSMNQGRPTSEQGDFFNIAKIRILKTADEIQQARKECIAWVRAHDNAATQDGGDTSVGMKGGIRSNGRVLIDHAWLKQVDTAGRVNKVKETAAEDGQHVVITIPNDPGSAGNDVVFFMQQALEGFTVVPRPTSANKESRATGFSAHVNDGMVDMVEGDWNKEVLTALRDFPLSDFDDPVDAGSDMFNQLYETFRKGLVLKNFNPLRNLTVWDKYASKFGNCKKIPANFNVYAGVKITPADSTPNSAAIVARAPENAGLGDKLFVVATYKEYTSDFYALFDWLDAAMEAYLATPKASTIWLHPDSAQYRHTIWQKLETPVAVFEGDEIDGLTELDYYMLPTEKESPFNPNEKDTGFLGILMDASQELVAVDEFGLYGLRQEAATWGYTDKNKPSAIGQVLDCVRMVTYCFRTVSDPLNKRERIEASLPPELRAENLSAMPNSRLKDQLMTRRMIEQQSVEKTIDKPVRGAHASRFSRR